MERRNRERAEQERLDRLGGKRAREAERCLSAPSDRRVATTPDSRRQPADGELERAQRRAVEPLHVVDGHDDRALGGKGLEEAEEAHGRRPRVRLPVGLGAQQRDVEGASLRRGQVVLQLGVRLCDEIGQRRVGERRLRLGGPRDEDAEPPPGGAGKRLAPDRRLADAGLAVEDERTAPFGDHVEKALDRGDVPQSVLRAVLVRFSIRSIVRDVRRVGQPELRLVAGATDSDPTAR